MYNIDSTGNAGGQFQDGDPVAGVDGTILAAAWLNAIQAELVNIVTAAGLTLDKTNSAQVLAAIKTLRAPTLLGSFVTYVKGDPTLPLTLDGSWHTLTVAGVPSTATWMYVGGVVENHGNPDNQRQSFTVRPSAARAGQAMVLSHTNGVSSTYENDCAFGPCLVPCNGSHIDYQWSDDVTSATFVIYGYL